MPFLLAHQDLSIKRLVFFTGASQPNLARLSRDNANLFKTHHALVDQL
jgi:hypothetical protein